MSDATVKVLTTETAMAEHVADWLVSRIENSTGRFAIALSGGGTPKPVYELLAAPARADRIDWSRVHLFWGDERFVPQDHPDSNYLMVRKALLDHVPLPAENIHPIPTSGHPQDAARAYASELQAFYGADTIDTARPLFDVNLMGVGDDGHTASLFPRAKEVDEVREWAVAVVGHTPEARISLTYPVLASSRDLIVLVAGAKKKAIMERVLAKDASLPAGRLRSDFQLTWFLDEAAAPNR